MNNKHTTGITNKLSLSIYSRELKKYTLMSLEHTNEITDKLSSLVYSQEVGNYSLQMAMFNIDGITNELCSSVYS